MKKIYYYSLVPLFVFILTTGANVYATRYSIDVRDFEFSPSNLINVRIGDTIHWEWKEGSHTTTSTTVPAGAANWDKPLNAENLTFDYVPTMAGVYHYKCTIHESMGMVGQFSVMNFTGITENARIPEISVYPNPVTGKLYFACALPEGLYIKNVTIYDAIGKIIAETSYEGQSSFPDHFDLSGLPEGLFLFKFTDNTDRTRLVRAYHLD